MITLAEPRTKTHGDELREHAEYVRMMMRATGETQATVDAEDLAKLLELAAWAADVKDALKGAGDAVC